MLQPQRFAKSRELTIIERKEPTFRSANEEVFGNPFWKGRRFSVYDEINLPPIQWLADGMVKLGGHHLLVGRTGGMKTYHLIDVFGRISNGMDIHSRATMQADTLIVIGEGVDEFVERRDDWARYHKAEKKPFIIKEPLQIHSKEDMDELECFLREHPSIKAIAFDTLSNCSTGVKLNEPDEVTAKINPVMSRFNAMGITTYLTHHMNKDGLTMRGAQALIDHTDKTWLLTNTDGNVKLREEKIRRGNVKKTMWFSAQSYRETAVLLPSVDKKPDTESTEDDRKKSERKKAVVVSTEQLVKAMFDDTDAGEILTTSQITDSIDRAESGVKAAIAAVCKEGYIEKVGHGKYRKA